MSAFQSQLRAIAAKSSHELDLRARRSAHAESLIFERDVAVKQDWETVYQICQDGFQELCTLDPRLEEFERNLFSPHSKTQDRDSLNRAENQALDTVIGRCLRALGKWVNVKPGVKSVEWLVRRFRAHVHNTDVILATFLPYHEQPIWRNVLRLVQEGSEGRPLAPEWKFLGPYLQLASNIPRHAIVYSMTNNDGFFRAFSTYVLKACEEESTWPQMMRVWTSVMVEALAGRLDQTKSGRKELQNQKLEDALLKILPVLEEGFEVRNCLEMTTACYTGAMVVVGAVELSDAVLDGIMERVAKTLDQAESDPKNALVCLAVLVSKKQKFKIPRKVLNSVMNTAEIESLLEKIGKKYLIQHLITAMLRTSLTGVKKQNYAIRIQWVEGLLRTGSQSCQPLVTAHWLQEMFELLQTLGGPDAVQSSTKARLVDVLQRLESLDTFKAAFRELRSIVGEGFVEYEAMLGMVVQPMIAPPPDVPNPMEVDQEDVNAESISDLFTNDLNAQLVDVTSFLRPSADVVFDAFSRVFQEACRMPAELQRFKDLPAWTGDSRTPLLFMSFLIRMACSEGSTQTRRTALRLLTESVNEHKHLDFQALLPYALVCLADKTNAVRKAAGDVLVAVASASLKVLVDNQSSQELGKDELYEPESLSKVHWISNGHTGRILTEAITPALEECVLDAKRLSTLLEEAMTGSTTLPVPGAKAASIDIKKGVRQSFFQLLASHAVATPLFKVKLEIIELLHSVQKVGNLSKAKELEPVLKEWSSRNDADALQLVLREKLDLNRTDSIIVQIVTPQDKEALNHTLSSLLDEETSRRKELIIAFFQHVRTIWTQLKHDSQHLAAVKLFALSTSKDSPLASDARRVLGELPLSTELLVALLEHAHAGMAEMPAEGPPKKKRRTSHGRPSLPAGVSVLVDDLMPKLTLALDLVESSHPGNHPELLEPLFRALEVIRRLRQQQQSDLPYALNLCLTNILAIVNSVKGKRRSDIEFSALRADMVTDLIRTSQNPQVQTSALLLSSSMAQLVPSEMVHNIMPIFTFMGHTIFSKSDEHSVNVIDRAVDQVIPPLVAALKKENGVNMVASASSLLSSFAAAFDHIPQSRRTAFYQRLLTRLNAADFAYALMGMIALRKSSDTTVRTFLSTLIAEFDVNVQITTYSKLLSLVSDVYSTSTQAAEALLGVSHNASIKVRNETASILLKLANSLLNNQGLKRKLNVLQKNDAEASKEALSLLKISISQTLQMIQVRRTEKKSIFELEKQCLDALLKLLSLSDLCTLLSETLEDLDKVGSKDLQPSALRILAEQIESRAKKDTSAQSAAIGLLPQLSSIIAYSTDPILKQAVVACIDRIADAYGRKDTASCLAAASTVVGNQCLDSDDKRLQTMSLLSLASIMDILKEAAVPLIPELLPEVLKILRSSIETGNLELHNASYALLSAVISHLAFVLSADHVVQILWLSAESSNAEIGSTGIEGRVEACTLLVHNLDFNALLTCLSQSWTTAIENGVLAMSEALQVFGTAIERASKTHLIEEAETTSAFLLQVLDLRRIQFTTRDRESYTDAEVDQIESELSSIGLKIIYKLNDKTFCPLFESWLDWALQCHDLASSTEAIQSKGQTLRATAVFRFLGNFFSDLKSIVTSYASYLLEPSNTILAQFSSYTKTPTKSLSLSQDDLTLYKTLLSLLSSVFTHDADGFFSAPSHFSPLSSNLISQLHLSHHGAFRLLINSHVIPTIVRLATAVMDTPTHHHSLNKSLCALRRSESAHVRLASIQTQLAITADEEVGEDWVNNVAGSGAAGDGGMGETMVYVNEMLEDDDEEVERSTREWVRRVREVVGEDVFEN